MIAIQLKVSHSGISFLSEVTESKIKSTLTALLDGIAQSSGDVIAKEMARLDELLEENRGNLHPQLIHFLERRSYAKAVMFLGGESDIPVGICGGRAGRESS